MFESHEVNAEHKDLIHDVAYDYYGRRMATCSSDQYVKVRNNTSLPKKPFVYSTKTRLNKPPIKIHDEYLPIPNNFLFTFLDFFFVSRKNVLEIPLSWIIFKVYNIDNY